MHRSLYASIIVAQRNTPYGERLIFSKMASFLVSQYSVWKSFTWYSETVQQKFTDSRVNIWCPENSPSRIQDFVWKCHFAVGRQAYSGICYPKGRGPPEA